METQRFGIHFGAMSPKISKQLKDQNLKFDKEVVKELEIWQDSILNLWFGGLLVDSQKEKLQSKLFKKILSHVKKQNKILNESERKAKRISA